MGSIERFLSVLIEHTGGALPLWLSPVQIAVHPISDKHTDPAYELATMLRANGLRVEVSGGNETIGKRIRAAETMKIPYSVVMGDKDIAAGVVSVRKRGGEDLGQLKANDFVIRLTDEVARKA
jgi:threonyl-tRNA synthetase